MTLPRDAQSAERASTAVAAPEDWDGLPTKADVKQAGRRAARAAQRAAVAAYREAHAELNPDASDATVQALIELERFALRGTGCDKPSGPRPTAGAGA